MRIRAWYLLITGTVLLVLAFMGGTAGAQPPKEQPFQKEDPTKAQASKIAPQLQQSFDLESPGTHLKYWVILKDQADTSNNIPNSRWADKGWYVYDALVKKANTTQAPLLSRLNSLKSAGNVHSIESFWIVNSISVEGDLASAQAMSADPGVAEVTQLLDSYITGGPRELSPQAQAVVDQALTEQKAQANKQTGSFSPLLVQHNIDEVRAPQAWTLGYDGTGIVVGSMDTGVLVTHEALTARYRGNAAPPDPNVHDYNWYDGYLLSATPLDQNGHGTHTMGTAVGNQLAGSPYGNIGVAKGATWMTVRICGLNGSNSCDANAILRGFQWTLAPTRVGGTLDPRPDLRPRVSNNSWGGSGCDTTYNTAVQNWVNAGIYPDFSTGNSGPGTGTVGSPASAPSAWGTGNLNTSIASWVIATSSSRGPSPCDSSIRPHAIAPGTSICSSVQTGNNAYNCSYTGTSMAAPHIAGAVAILLDKNENLTISQLTFALTSTAFFSSSWGTLPNNNYGWGLIQIDTALNSVTSPGTPTRTPTGPTVTPTRTRTPTSTPCGTNANYSIATGTATIVPGTTDTGNHTDDGTTAITLPFTYNLYGQPFTTANVSSNGTLQFSSNSTDYTNTCLPYASMNNTIFPHWDDQLTTGTCSPAPCGIFTSVSGGAPNRIFNIEWRTTYFSGGGTANYEIRLYEGQNRFDLIYGTLTQGGSSATVGVQRDTGSQSTQFECNTASTLTSGLLLTFTQTSCGTSTRTPTNTITNTPTRTLTRTNTPTITPTSPPCGPGSNYVYTQSTGATIVAGTTDIGNHTDDGTTTITLPFSYSLYGQLFNTVNASSNGNLQFTSNRSDFGNECLPTATVPMNNLIAPHWDDLMTNAAGDGIFTSVSGSAPNRIFNIEWRACLYSGGVCGGDVDFEVRLYEGQSRFDFIYGTVTGGGGSTTVGVQRDTGSQSTQFECGTGGLSSGMMLRFAQPASGYRVLLIHADIGGGFSGLQSAIQAQGNVAFADLFDASTGTPTLAQLQQYDIVVAMSNSPYLNPVTLGNNLADYQDAGGVAVAVFGSFYNSGNYSIQGRWQTGGYSPYTYSTSILNDAVAIGTVTVGHPLMQGVTALGARSRLVVVPGASATQVAAYSESTSAVAFKSTAGHIAVGLTAYIGDTATVNGTGDYARVIVNAGRWLKPNICLTSLVGQVSWQGRTAGTARFQFPISLTLKLGTGEVNYAAQNTDVNGFFSSSVSMLAAGTYNWRVKGPKYLANCGTVGLPGFNVTQQGMGTMQPGDADGNNLVTVADFNILKNSTGRGCADPGYDDRADFNGDCLVNTSDFNLMKPNVGRGGCSALGPAGASEDAPDGVEASHGSPPPSVSAPVEKSKISNGSLTERGSIDNK